MTRIFPKMSDPLLLCLVRPDIEAKNLKPFLRRFGKHVLPKGRKLARMMGTFSFFVDGYNDSPDEIYAIQPVRDYYAALHSQWPYWLYFCDLRGESLHMILACLLGNVESHKIIGAPSAYLRLDPLEMLQFLSDCMAPMNEICERAGLSEYEIWKRTKAVFEYFNFPFDSPPPR